MSVENKASNISASKEMKFSTIKPPLFITLLTIIILTTLTYSSYQARELVTRYAPLTNKNMEIKFDLTMAHLWFEDAISGDQTVQIATVWKYIESAKMRAQSMIEENETGQISLLDNSVLCQNMTQIIANIDEFENIARKRWRLRVQSVIGSTIDQHFDIAFLDIIQATDNVQAELKKIMNNQLRYFGVEQNFLIILVCLSGMIVGWLLYRSQRRQEDNLLQLQRNENKLRVTNQVFSENNEGICICDSDKKIIDANNAFLTITGYDKNDVIGQSVEFLSTGLHSVYFYKRLWRSLDMNGFWKGELLSCRKNGDTYDQSLSISTVKNEQGAMKTYIAVISDISESKGIRKQIEFLAQHDEMTALPNRSLFSDRFQQAVAHAKRTEAKLAVCFLDVDDFKTINDDHGHEAGDQLLIEVANRLKKTMREQDTVSRHGGDEFALLFTDLQSYEQCIQTVERLHQVLAEPYSIQGRLHTITVSTGVTLYPLDDGDIDTLLRHADQAMYQAKLAGKNRYAIFDITHEHAIREQHFQHEEIAQAYKNGEFQLYYQPKVNMRTGKVVGAEALIRWFHPEKGMISPMEFLPLIENTALEIKIGNWVINEAVKQLNEWHKKELNLEVSINVSSYHLLSMAFLDQLSSALKNYPAVEPQTLQLEILESSTLGDINAISAIINSCQNVLGITVALDDFGTGYSALSHLRTLPVSTIKIDRSFVSNMIENRDDMALVESIIGLARTFNRGIIAEGVETAEQGVVLIRLGCDYGQGYGIARPMPADELADWVASYCPNETWSLWAGSEWEMSNLPLVVAQSDHIAWIQKIFNVLDGVGVGLNHDELTDHYECRLGSWYYGHGKQHYGDLDAFHQLESLHIEVHSTGIQIIELHNQGKKKKARLLSEKLLSLKSEVLDSLNELQKQVIFNEA